MANGEPSTKHFTRSQASGRAAAAGGRWPEAAAGAAAAGEVQGQGRAGRVTPATAAAAAVKVWEGKAVVVVAAAAAVKDWDGKAVVVAAAVAAAASGRCSGGAARARAQAPGAGSDKLGGRAC